MASLLRLRSFAFFGSTSATTNSSASTTYKIATNYIIRNKSTIGTKCLSTDAATKNQGSQQSQQQFDAKDEQEIVQKLKHTFEQDIISGSVVPVFKKALLYGNKVAIKDEFAEYSYAQLYAGAKKLANQLNSLCG